MNKLKQLQKMIVALAIRMAVMVAVFGAIYAGVAMYAGTVEKEKEEATSKYTQDNAKLTDYRSQINKSDYADKRYSDIMADRTNTQFTSDIVAIQAWLRVASEQYKLNGMRLTPKATEISDRPEFANIDFTISLRKGMRLEFNAVSDLHVFSFLQDLGQSAPGIVRVEKLTIRRTSDITDANIAAIASSGAMPLLVNVTVDLTWIGIDPKAQKSNDPSASPSP